MNIHALCLVKNEADVIEHTLRTAAGWCDWIYVLDNGSRDGTWEKVQALALELTAVVPYRQDPRPFDDAIRDDLLRRYAARAKRGDWWCILDADELYVDDPRRFLSEVPRKYRAVWMERYVYLFTDKDLAAYRRDPELYADSVPVDQRLHYYVVGEYTEPRFFRHARALKHVPGRDLRPIYPRRIRLKHFAYRSPDQIRTRLETRREPMQRGEFVHEKRANWVPGGILVHGPAKPDELPRSWEERVTPSTECHFDRRDGTYAAADPWQPPAGDPWARRLGSKGRRLLGRFRSTGSRLLRRR